MPLKMLMSMWGIVLALVVLIPLGWWAYQESQEAETKADAAKRTGRRAGNATGGAIGIAVALVVGIVGGAYQALGGLQPLGMMLLDFVFANPELSANVAIAGLGTLGFMGFLNLQVWEFLLGSAIITAIAVALAAWSYRGSNNAGITAEREGTERELFD